MKNRLTPLFYLLFLGLFTGLSAQETQGVTEKETTALFADEGTLPVRLNYSNTEMKRKTNDSTYLNSVMQYQKEDGNWDSLEIRLRARGNWRMKNCFLTPVKIRIRKAAAKGTLFDGNKELKVVLPCSNSDVGQDWVLKELLAYKMYEIITPFHFKTRRLAINYTDQRGKKGKDYQLEGFLIEDISRVADRVGGKKLKRAVHPLQQDDICSIQNDFFQYMIGNTDYSAAYQHNGKLIFVEGMKAIPVPYDFDMSGLVNASYAVVSEVQNEKLPITRVTQRLFRGWQRDNALYEETRQLYISKKPEIMALLNSYKSEFNSSRQFEDMQEFITEFFEVLEDQENYRNKIMSTLRTSK